MSDTGTTHIKTPNDINLRLSHPNLYRSIVTFSIMSICLGLNFLFRIPPFNGYGIDITIVAWIFLTIGIVKLYFLHFNRNLQIVRFMMALGVGWLWVWGIGTALTFPETTLQLFILYVGLAWLETWSLIDPFTNPATGRQDP